MNHNEGSPLMPVITDSAAPRFDAEGTHVVGLASPSRGAVETSAWHLRLDPGHASPAHTLDREEIFVALSGSAVATFSDSNDRVEAGGALIVPAGREFTISNPGPDAFEAVVVLPAGARATVDGTEMVPPWAA
jgi:mannose-6-phosphate isomerase-like protein (cupin superfamily)